MQDTVTTTVSLVGVGTLTPTNMHGLTLTRHTHAEVQEITTTHVQAVLTHGSTTMVGTGLISTMLCQLVQP